MPNICHRVGIAAPPARVYDAFATTEGLTQWWTPSVEGSADPGGTLKFYFGGAEPAAVMEVAELVPRQRVEWRCVGGAAQEWIGTRLTFDLKAEDGETVVLFTHADWREPSEFMYHCSTKWAYFLLQVKAWLEGGEATPHPHDLKISSWG